MRRIIITVTGWVVLFGYDACPVQDFEPAGVDWRMGACSTG
jgi:hypothetical protein